MGGSCKDFPQSVCKNARCLEQTICVILMAFRETMDLQENGTGNLGKEDPFGGTGELEGGGKEETSHFKPSQYLIQGLY